MPRSSLGSRNQHTAGFLMGTKKERLKTAIREELLARMTSGPDKQSRQLSADWLYGEYLPTLSAKEEEALEEAIAEMIADGVIVAVPGRDPTYRLTSKGETT
jgi:hypothetical protein